jgi:diguanylate cyclase (GGDEF)-like protein
MSVAVWLAFILGFSVARDVGPVTPQAVAVVAAAGVAVVILQFVVHVWVILRDLRIEQALKLSGEILGRREEQLWLLERLTQALNRPGSSRELGRKAADFFIDDMDAERVFVWQTNSSGEPTAPVLLRSSRADGEARLEIAEQQRAVLAGNAARTSLPIVVDGLDSSPHPLDASALPAGPFGLFLPLLGREVCEGVLEIYSRSPWAPQRWEIIGTIALYTAAALERGRKHEEMREQAESDFVTGLYNHRFMLTYLHRLLSATDTHERAIAVLLLDVDDFKAFNDHLGHGAGDRVLQTVADQLKLMTRRAGVVGRSGGDEFMVVLPDHRRADVEAFVRALQDWLATDAATLNGLYRIRVSCGYAIFPEDADNHQELLAIADARLYRAKTGGRRAWSRSGREDGRAAIGVYGLLDRIISDIDSRDNYTRAHCELTAEYAVALAQELGLSPPAQRTLRMAALLHDIGKIGIPEEILRKPGPLGPDEYSIVKHQVHVASQLIEDIPNAAEVRSLVRHSRERWDGKGYPSGLKGKDIPYLARILAVAGTYAALTLDRPYRKALPPEMAYEELLASAGTQLDPDIVLAFARVIKPHGPAPAALGVDLKPLASNAP